MDKQESSKIERSERYYYWLGLKIAGDFGVTIAVPALVATYAGKKLDEYLDSSPWLLIVCVALALVITAIMIVRKAKIYEELYKNGK